MTILNQSIFTANQAKPNLKLSILQNTIFQSTAFIHILLILIILIFIIMSNELIAQEQNQGTAPNPPSQVNENNEISKEAVPDQVEESLNNDNKPIDKPADKEEPKEQFLDKNQNGIDDRKENLNNSNKSGNHRRGRHFVDEDGDGINDNRCTGMGIGRGKGRHAGKKK